VLIPSPGRCSLMTGDLPREYRQPITGCAVLPCAPVVTVRGETHGLRLDECGGAPRELWRCSHSASTSAPARASVFIPCAARPLQGVSVLCPRRRVRACSVGLSLGWFPPSGLLRAFSLAWPRHGGIVVSWWRAHSAPLSCAVAVRSPAVTRYKACEHARSPC
jgi:hypothetical protein